jgi:hypothetical protein
MGLAPQRIDMILDMERLAFDDCWKRRAETDIGGIAAYFISAEDLIANKEAVARYQDLADAEKLRIAQQRDRKYQNERD